MSELPGPLDPTYRIAPLSVDGTNADDVLALWQREGVLGGEEALRRVHEVQLVATVAATEELVGVSTAPLVRVGRLGMDLWYFRAYVVEAHRFGDLALQLLDRCRAALESKFVDGTDRRAAGVFISVQNEGLQRTQNQGVWRRTHFVYIGDNARGHHLRVRYFPGAVAPPFAELGP